MFIIKIGNTKQLFLNSKTENFIKPLCEQMGIEESDIEAHMIDEDYQKQITRTMRLNFGTQFEFDLDGKKLLKVERASASVGAAKPMCILNLEPVGDGVELNDPTEISESAYSLLDEASKKQYLKAIKREPRAWEKAEYISFFSATEVPYFLANDPETQNQLVEVLTFKTKRVVKINYSPTVNSLTGEVGQKVESMEFEE
jgi:hypothetical protein